MIFRYLHMDVAMVRSLVLYTNSIAAHKVRSYHFVFLTTILFWEFVFCFFVFVLKSAFSVENLCCILLYVCFFMDCNRVQEEIGSTVLCCLFVLFCLLFCFLVGWSVLETLYLLRDFIIKLGFKYKPSFSIVNSLQVIGTSMWSYSVKNSVN